MKILSFKYTKADDSVSNRTLAVMVKPQTMFEGIDISSLEAVDQAGFIDDISITYNRYLAELEEIKKEYDLVHDYRRFDPKKMTEVVEEEI